VGARVTNDDHGFDRLNRAHALVHLPLDRSPAVIRTKRKALLLLMWAGIGAYRIPSESAVEKINVARSLKTEGFILFSYDFTARPSELNPDGAYLERIRRAAF